MSIKPVPSDQRSSTPVAQFWIWAGANVAPINWVLGTIGIELGLSFLQTMAVIVIGNLLGATLFGLFCMMGHRTGVNQLVLSRLAFGRRGAYLVCAGQLLMSMAWVGVNTWVVLDFAVAALDRMGVQAGPWMPYAIAAVIMLIQIGLAVKGFRAIQVFERWTMPVVLLVMAAMTVLALTREEFQPMATHGTGPGGIVAMSQLMTAIGIGWSITWLVYASDYTRFVPATVPPKKVFTSTALGMFLPTVWLSGLGAALASSGSATDPAQLVITAFGAMSLPVLLLVLHGPIAANIVVMYSASLAALSMDLRTARWKIPVATGVIASAVLVWFLNAQNVGESFKQWLISLVFWMSPWAGICLVDFFILRRGRIAVDDCYEPASTSRLGAISKRGMLALAAGLVAAWSFQVGAVSALTGPLSRSTGGLDLSWLTGMLVGGGVYWLLARKTVAPSIATTPVNLGVTPVPEGHR
ncbi:purine-cytosine permease family protein [Streptomyces chartreusis]|uniref:purine-cytosine permease family protein n=1 Tax=Streptomyces chartreusis TaxID=1969 RepID=UPI0036B1DB42